MDTTKQLIQASRPLVLTPLEKTDLVAFL
jgi:hypothetical protein